MVGIFVLQTKNRFDSLTIDTGDCENHIEDADIESVKPLSLKKQPRNKRPNVVVSRYPQGNMNHKLIPGNSAYSNIAKKGRKMSILGDSIPSTIEMKEFNHCLKERINSHLIRKSFPGVTPLELAHYCIPTLIKEMPDVFIIYVGINCIKYENPNKIQQDILKIVERCQSYGVNYVFVSAVTIMDRFVKESINMSSFSTTHLEKKIKILTMSQQSIQTLSLWSIHHRKHARTVVATWFKELQKVKPKKKMALMYLANDILQNSRRKGTEYSKEFASVLPNAFAHCCQDGDEKTIESLKRILTIWLERNVYDNVVISRLMKCCDQTGFGEESSNTPDEDDDDDGDDKSEQVEEVKFTSKDMKRPANPPDPDEIVRRLQELENSATQDAVVREKIANLPTEVTDPTYIDKVEDLESARKLQASINSACELLAEYNARLAAEQVDRQIAQKMLIDYTLMQKYQLALTEERLEEYEAKLQKVTAVKKELQAHLENLPDLTKLPNPVPLPSAGDLFASSSKGR